MSCGYSVQLKTGLCYILLEAAHKGAHSARCNTQYARERISSEAAELTVMLTRWRVAPGRFDQRVLRFRSSRVAQPVGRAAQVVQRIVCTAQVSRAEYMLLHVAHHQPMREDVDDHPPFALCLAPLRN